MDQKFSQAPGTEALATEKAVELPRRYLLATVSVLGLPLLGVSDVAVSVNTAGPGWLIGS